MLKKDFINMVAEKSGVPQKDTAAVVAAMLETVRETLSKDDSISFLGFGTFKVTKRAARVGRNPQTGEPLKIKAAKLPVFKASAKLKEYINAKKAATKAKKK